MSYGIICRQKGNGGCNNLANFRYTWPGQNESFVCAEHAARLKDVAAAMGMPLQLIVLTGADHSGPLGMESIDEQRNADKIA